ncbi:hypothetical protein CANARDRAFT_26392, partial [[Candida] arabinofermentans NRRL YB-2248]
MSSRWQDKVRQVVPERLSLSSPVENALSSKNAQKLIEIGSTISQADLLSCLDTTPIESCTVLEAQLINFSTNGTQLLALLQTLITDIALPKTEFCWFKPDETSEQTKFRLGSYYKIRLIKMLFDVLDSETVNNVDHLLLLNNLSYYIGGDTLPWSTDKTSDLAKALLADTPPTKIFELLTSLEPELMRINEMNKSNSKVTAKGYKRLRINQLVKGISPLSGISYSDQLDQSDLFKLECIGRISTLEFVIETFPLNEIELNWGMILPLLLHFLDDTDLLVKAQAIRVLNILLLKVQGGNSSIQSSNNIIKKTEIGTILYEGIVPALLALPSLTPAEQSALILPVAYKTTILLFQVSSPSFEDYCIRMSSLINDFILPSLTKIREIPSLAIIFVDLLKFDIIEDGVLGNYIIIDSGKVLYAILDLLLDPYIIYSRELLQASVSLITSLVERLQNRQKYSYDILACMMMLLKRMNKYQVKDVGTIKDDIERIIGDDLMLNPDELKQVHLELESISA